MFKPLQGAHGTLAMPLNIADNVMFVDAQLIASVAAALGVGDTTYMLIEQAGVSEAVRVTDYTPVSLLIDRGMDGSTPSFFSVGATIRYILTAEAVNEIVVDYVATLGLDAVSTYAINAPHTVTKVDSLVTIDIVPTVISSPGGTIDVMNNGINIEIDIERGAFGCCDD